MADGYRSAAGYAGVYTYVHDHHDPQLPRPRFFRLPAIRYASAHSVA